MRLPHSITSLHPDSAAIAKRALAGAVLLTSLAALTLGSSPALGDEQPDATEQAAAVEADSDRLSERQQRREERRQRREAERSDAGQDPASEAADTESAFVVYVEPEIVCRKVAVTGSRMAKEVCKPVGLAAVEEENAQEFLRRMRELSTLVPAEEERPNPLMQQGGF